MTLVVSAAAAVAAILVTGAGASAPSAGPVTGTASGTVLVNGKVYTGGPIPYGSKVDVTKGKVTLKANVGTLTASGGGGITAVFVLLRLKVNGKPFIELRLTGASFGVCGKAVRTSSALAVTTKKPPTTVRRLFTKGKGSFRTRGRYASTTVRGTDWLTADRCDGTLVKVRQGVVSVLDLVLKTTSIVKAGQSYTAKKPATAAVRIVGDFAGRMVFHMADGTVWQTQTARLSVNEAPAKASGSVRWTYVPVPWNAPAICTHNLVRTRVDGNVESFRVASMTGSCIPNAESYRISRLGGGRVAVHLFYKGGVTASGVLSKK